MGIINKLIQEFIKRIFYSLLFFHCLFCLSAFGSDTVSIRNLSADQYYSSVMENVKNARISVLAGLSSLSCKTNNPDDPVFRMIQSLVLASMEGIKVVLVLNPFYTGELSNCAFRDKAMELIRNSRILLITVPEPFSLRFNQIIIDQKIILESSIPWISGIDTQNHLHSSWIITSAKLAEEKTKLLSPLVEKGQKWTMGLSSPVLNLPASFIENNQIAYFMKNKTGALLDCYLYLLKEQSSRNTKWLSVSFSSLFSSLFSEASSKTQSRKKVLGILKKLKRDSFIELEWVDEQSVRVKIKNDDPQQYFMIPERYFTCHHDRDLELREKLLYLWMLYQATKGRAFPLFQMDESFYQAIPKIKKSDMESLLSSLEKKMLIEFYPPAVITGKDSLFMPAFLFLDPMDLKILQQSLETLKDQYGEREVKKARMILTQVNRENDPEAVAEILYYLKKIGMVETQKVFYLVCSLPPYHPNRNYTHIISRLGQSAAAEKMK
ncbi:MAG: hypothetical protein JW774_02665 [Candidatus Aureabacteria bacterium]|nr:hypothetical protein [Candidatus Auribacterota bacterium]